MKQIQARDVQSRGHPNGPSRGRHPLREVEADRPVVQTRIDVGGRDVDESMGAGDLGHSHQDLHRELRRRTVIARQAAPVPIVEIHGLAMD